MFTKEMINKIDSFLHKNFDIIFDFEFNGLLLLWGGAIKSIIMDTPVNDLDFILLIYDSEKENISDFLKKNNLDYYMKSNYIYITKYNNYQIDLSFKNDLLCNGYNTDLIFYDIHRKQVIPIGIKEAVEKRQIKIFGYSSNKKQKDKEHLKHLERRLCTAKKFIQFMRNDTKRVMVVRKNKYYKRKFLKFFKYLKRIKRKLFKRY